VDPAADSVAPAPIMVGRAEADAGRRGWAIDGSRTDAVLERHGARRAILRLGGRASRVLVLPAGPPVAEEGRGRSGEARLEVIVDGWRLEVALEPEARASLRERARRGRRGPGVAAPAEVRAIIPGRIGSVAVAPGDQVVAGQPLLVVEAMKMQNELRAPRAGTVRQVAVIAGQTVEAGALLVAIE
jgi:biotin carboxyl carrier protein